MTHQNLSQYVILLFALCVVVNAGQWQCGATSLTAASMKQCPASASISCSVIGGDDYCCPAGTTCQWTNGVVGCCSGSGACQGQIGAQAPAQAPATTVWQPTTTYWQPVQSTVYQQPTTVYQQPTTVYTGQSTVYGGQQTVYVAGGAATSQVAQPQSTKLGYLGNYCSTQVAVGPNLPTTGTGPCGTILIVAGAPKLSLKPGIWMLTLSAIVLILRL